MPSNRQSYISGVSSNRGNGVSGVPRRSVYIADIFADASTISSHSKSFEELTSTLFEELNKIDHWCDLNSVAINVTKSKVMCVTYTHNQSIIPQDFSLKSSTNVQNYTL